jgi:hypothetical protein
MSHLSVRTLIEETVNGVDDSIKFGYARASDFNSILQKGDKAAHLDVLSSVMAYTEDSYNLTATYSPAIIFYKLDDLQGAEKETADILDITDSDSTKFIQSLNLKTTNLDQDVTISNIRKEPIIKVTVNCMTGFLLRFDITVPDDFNYCLND